MSIDKEVQRTTSLTNTKGSLSQSWNGFSNVRPSFEFSDYRTATTQDGDRENEIKTEKRHIKHLFLTPENYYHQRTNPKVMDYREMNDQKVVRMPRNFPGVKHIVFDNEPEEKKTSNETKQLQTEPNNNLTLEDMEKVLGQRKGNPRREGNPGREGNLSREGNPRREGNLSREKLPRIKISEPLESPSESQPSLRSPRVGSHHFNYVRMMTELNEVCKIKNDTVARQGETEDNLLKLKTIHETRRYSVFTPRRSGGDRVRQHTRCRSLPNLDMQAFPKRYFVKLDPVRASAVPVNLSAWNDSSKQCRMVSENLRKLDQQGIAPTEKERKKLIGQWIRETTQVEIIHDKEQHSPTEVES